MFTLVLEQHRIRKQPDQARLVYSGIQTQAHLKPCWALSRLSCRATWGFGFSSVCLCVEGPRTHVLIPLSVFIKDGGRRLFLLFIFALHLVLRPPSKPQFLCYQTEMRKVQCFGGNMMFCRLVGSNWKIGGQENRYRNCTDSSVITFVIIISFL